MIKVKVPATSANLGAGFDCMGIALSLYNEVWVEDNGDKGLKIITEYYIPKDETNIVYSSIIYAFKQAAEMQKNVQNNAYYKQYLSGKALNLKFTQINNIPVASGLGSSASCIVGGVLIANELLGNVFSKQEQLFICSCLDGHPDNVAPAMLGGVVTSVQVDNEIVYSQAEVKSIKVAVFNPNFSLKTTLSRAILPKKYNRSDVVYNLQRAVLTFFALANGDKKMLGKVVSDKLHEPYRKDMIRDFDKVKDIALSAGAICVYISGAGPCIACFIDNNFDKSNVAIFLDSLQDKWKVFYLDIENCGAKIL